MVLVGSFLALAVSLAMGADAPSSAAKLTAEQVIEKNVAARGGLQAWRAVQTLSMSGKMDAGGNESPTRPVQGVRTGGVQLPKRPAEQAQLPFRLELKRTRKSRLELDFSGDDCDPGLRWHQRVEIASVPQPARSRVFHAR